MADPTTATTRETDDGERLSAQFAGLDALERAPSRRHRGLRRTWSALWPKALAIGIVLAVWQCVVWSGWRDPWVLPGPGTALAQLGQFLGEGMFWQAIGITMGRALIGFAIAIVVGTVLGALVAQIRPLRAAIGSLLAGLLTMPSIAWLPLAILLFRLSESAILFVIVIGAAPSIAGGLVNGIDYIQPILLRAGRVLGLRGWPLYRSVILPASLPSYVSGLKQGWAFAWRGLMAGELMVIIANRPSIGVQLNQQQEYSDAAGMLAMMIVILVIGICVDSAFGAVDRTIQRRWGVTKT